eukprot:9483955-Pyramimonas_sp.AAC.1
MRPVEDPTESRRGVYRTLYRSDTASNRILYKVDTPCTRYGADLARLLWDGIQIRYGLDGIPMQIRCG